jgi:hypothetical protein
MATPESDGATGATRTQSAWRSGDGGPLLQPPRRSVLSEHAGIHDTNLGLYVLLTTELTK